MRITTTTNGDIAIIIPRKDFDQFFVQRDLFSQPKIDLKGLHLKTIEFLKEIYLMRGDKTWQVNERDIRELRKKHGIFDITNTLKTSLEKGIIIKKTNKIKNNEYSITYKFD